MRNVRDTYVGIVRSGQIIRSTGDIVVVGDVNPNGRVEAGGNIYVIGKLKGIAHAGVNGNTDAIIAASHFEPTHVLIADCVEVMTNEQPFVLAHSEQYVLIWTEVGLFVMIVYRKCEIFDHFYNSKGRKLSECRSDILI